MSVIGIILVRIFQHLGKYGPESLRIQSERGRIRTLFTQRKLSKIFKETGRILTRLQLFSDVRATFLKTGVIFANFRQLSNLPFSNDFLK